MSIKRQNIYLDAGQSEEEDAASHTGEIEESRTSRLDRHVPKRRRLSASSHGTDSTEDEVHSEILGRSLRTKSDDARSPKRPQQAEPNALNRPGSQKADPKSPAKTKKKPSKPGVIYLSRILPFMRPSTVRTLLSPYGHINQLFLTPEAPATYAARKNHGGNKKRSFIDGWVEFKHKRHAKACVDGINGQTVGGKKGGWYRDDVWNAKYLKGFSWDDLMASVRQEEREREERVRVGIAKDRREREAFLRGLESAKVEETRERKRTKRREKTQDEGALAKDGVHATEQSAAGFDRSFRQNDIRGPATNKQDRQDDVTRILGKIF